MARSRTTDCSLKTRARRLKLDRFTLIEENPGRWKVSGRDFSGRYRRIRFQAEDQVEAIRKAGEILHTPPREEDQGFPRIEIGEALRRSSLERNWTASQRQNDEYSCTYFLDFVDRLGLVYWHELRFEHVSAYVKELSDRGRAYDTIRLYLSPVRRAARWAACNWPRHYVNICTNLKISNDKARFHSYDEEFGNPVLLVHQVLDFLEWLVGSKKWNRLAAGVALQGLAGLQLQEALRLCWGNVDFDSGTITIDGEVKNRFRIRRLPVCGVVLWLLRWHRRSFEVRTPNDNRVLRQYQRYEGYSDAVRKALALWDPKVALKPKDLRNTLQTAAIDGGWYDYYLKRYVGHAPTTIGERHYFGDQGKRLIPLFQEKVVKHIEAEISTWDAPEPCLILPGPRLARRQEV